MAARPASRPGAYEQALALIRSGEMLNSPPPGFLNSVDLRRVLGEVLAGVPLGSYEQQIIDWLAGWDTSTVVTVAALIAHARVEERRRAADEFDQLAENAWAAADARQAISPMDPAP